MSLAYMQKHGHRPIALVGGGTGLVGDPSGKDEMRQIMTKEEIRQNGEAQRNSLPVSSIFQKTGPSFSITRLVDQAELYRLPAGYWRPFQCQSHAGYGIDQDSIRKWPLLYRIQLSAPAGL